jgi:hypothetical protein
MSIISLRYAASLLAILGFGVGVSVGPSFAEPPSSKKHGMRFASEADALDWIAQRAQALGVGEVSSLLDTTGQPAVVNVLTVGPTTQDAEQKLINELGGGDGEITIAGHKVKLFSPLPDIAVIEQQTPAPKASVPQCNGGLCTDNYSFKNNYYFYRSIGGGTKVTRGGSGQVKLTTVPGTFLFEFLGRNICGYTTMCPSGTQPVDTGSCAFDCYTPATTVISLSAVFFARENGLLLPAVQRSQTVAGTSAEIKLSQWGVLIGSGGVSSQCSFELGGSTECSLIGVCTQHQTAAASGRTEAITAAGTTENCAVP